MKAEKEEYTVTNIKVTLNREEALWLKRLVQNPVAGPVSSAAGNYTIDENPRDKKIRHELWTTLNALGIGS